MIHAKADRIDKLLGSIPIEDVDVLVHEAPRADHLLNLQIEHIKERHSVNFNGTTCNFASGSEDCREHIRVSIWPKIDKLAPTLRQIALMRTASLEGIMTLYMMIGKSAIPL